MTSKIKLIPVVGLGLLLSLGSTYAMIPTIDINQNQMVYAQDLTSEQAKQLEIVKNNLAGTQPVNLEQLIKIDDVALMDYYNQANQTQQGDQIWKAIYDQLATDHPELDLLQGQEYEDYMAISKVIEENSDYTISDLNPALPRDILAWYQEAAQATPEDSKATVEAITPKIAEAITAYQQRKEERLALTTEEASTEAPTTEAPTTETPTTEAPTAEVPTTEAPTTEVLTTEAPTTEAPTTEASTTEASTTEAPTTETTTQEMTDLDKLQGALVKETSITQEQLNAIGSDAVSPFVSQAVASDFKADGLQTIASNLIMAYPDQFTPEQVQTEFEVISKSLLEATPITQEQLKQMDKNTVLTTANRINLDGGDPSGLYNQLLDLYPEIFSPVVEGMKERLVKENKLNPQQVSALTANQLLWAEYQAFTANNNQEDYTAFAEILKTEYRVQTEATTQSETTTQVETTTEELDKKVTELDQKQSNLEAMKKRLIEEAGLTQGQLDKIGNDNIEKIIHTSKLQVVNLSNQEVVGYAHQLISVYPDVFPADQVELVADNIRQTLTESGLFTLEIANNFTDQELLQWKRASDQQNPQDPHYIFKQAYTKNPDLFKNLAIEAKTTLVEKTKVKRELLDKVPSDAIILALYGQKDSAADSNKALQDLKTAYPQIFAETKPEIQTTEATTQDPKKKVVKKTGVESSQKNKNNGFLPGTGESANGIVGAVVLLLGAGLVYYSKKK